MSGSKTKILYIITKGNWGGAQRYVYDLASSLPQDDFDVSVACGEPGRLVDALTRLSITTYVLRQMKRNISFFKEFHTLFDLYRLIKKVHPDIVHVNSSKAGGLGALAARLAGTPRIIFTAHGWPFWEERHAITRALIYFFSWLTIIFSTKTIVISNYDRDVALRMPFVQKKIVRIYNGIDLKMTFGSGEKIRSAFPPGVKITGTVGELTKNKNHLSLIEKAQKDPNMYVAIIGEGELHDTLTQYIQKNNLSDRVKLFGFIPAIDVLTGFDTFSLPSKKEGLPYVLLEAKCAGLSLDARRVGGVGEILDKDIHEFSLSRMLSETIKVYQVSS